jgi:hypothetical protein
MSVPIQKARPSTFIRRWSQVTNTTGLAVNQVANSVGDIGAQLRGLIVSDQFEVSWKQLKCVLHLHARSDSPFILRPSLVMSENGATLVGCTGLDLSDQELIDTLMGLEPYEFKFISQPRMSKITGTTEWIIEAQWNCSKDIRRCWKTMNQAESHAFDLNFVVCTWQNQSQSVIIQPWCYLEYIIDSDKQSMSLIPN